MTGLCEPHHCKQLSSSHSLLCLSHKLMCMVMYMQGRRALAVREQKVYAKAGAIAEEVFSSIRTVVAFGGQRTMSNR